MYLRYLLLIILCYSLSACGRSKLKADLIVRNARVYTADGGMAVLQSFAVRDGKFVAVGTDTSIAVMYEADSILDAAGKTILPGLIDAHCHFVGYATGLQECNLVGTKSFDEVVKRVQDYSKTNQYPWIIGRGWDQNDWAAKEFPTREILDSLFPSKPVLLIRIDGHAALANALALQKAGINDSTKISGGEIIRPITKVSGTKKNPIYEYGPATGILIDNAVDLVQTVIPHPDENRMREALLTAQENCFAVGITTVDDAGLLKWQIDQIDQLQKNGELKMRVYAMLSDSAPNYEYYLKNGPYKTDYLNVRSFKFYADGALGSRGACMLENYNDKAEWKGFLLNSPAHYESKMKLLAEKKFQVCTHCIGDSANRFILRLYNRILTDSSQRWRIEHAQVVNAQDVDWFSKHQIIPSVQPVHATSDMYWVEKRLGPTRIKEGYVYRDLLQAAGILALGTDFPVENINPMYTFYAAVARKDLKQYPANGFQKENAIDRRSALLGMTRWAAYSNFEENEKGSIEVGKFADFILLDADPMTCQEDAIPEIKVEATYIAGKKVFERK
jgi:predicted amidohydrolase YtcJ